MRGASHHSDPRSEAQNVAVTLSGAISIRSVSRRCALCWSRRKGCDAPDLRSLAQRAPNSHLDS
jgi:hypothetical protein